MKVKRIVTMDIDLAEDNEVRKEIEQIAEMKKVKLEKMWSAFARYVLTIWENDPIYERLVKLDEQEVKREYSSGCSFMFGVPQIEYTEVCSRISG